MTPWLARIFGWPHELLHVLALWLIGQKPEAITQTHVDIPDNLSAREYVFVAGLPALVFWGGALSSALALFESPDLPQALFRLLLTLVLSVAAWGTLGDIQLILARLIETQTRRDED